MTSCRLVRPLLEAFVDGELGTDRVCEIQQHLLDCRICTERVRLSYALRRSLRRAVLTDSAPSPAFTARVAQALAAERARESERTSSDHTGPSRMLRWRTILPVAAAAAITLAFAASVNDTQRGGWGEAPRAPTSAGLNGDQLLEELVNDHARSPVLDVTEPSLVRRIEPEVGLNLEPPSLQQYGAQWQGARVVSFKNQRAALMRYNLGGHRISLYVYDSVRMPLRSSLEVRVVGNAPVYVGARRGYSIAAVERRGVGYALMTDLDDRESAELVASIH